MPDITQKSMTTVDIDTISPHPRNARRGNATLIEDSIEQHGVYRPVVVQRSTGHIIAGNHTWAAAKAKDRTRIPVVWLDVDDEEAERILIMDNRSNDLAVYDDQALAGLLAGLVETEVGLSGTGFSEAALDDLLTRLDTTMSPNVADIDARLVARNASPMRQIILVMTEAEFDHVIARLVAVEAAHPELDNNTSAILWALDQVEA